MHPVQNDSSNLKPIYLVLICSQYFAKVSDHWAVRLSSCGTTDTQPCISNQLNFRKMTQETEIRALPLFFWFSS